MENSIVTVRGTLTTTLSQIYTPTNGIIDAKVYFFRVCNTTNLDATFSLAVNYSSSTTYLYKNYKLAKEDSLGMFTDSIFFMPTWSIQMQASANTTIDYLLQVSERIS